MHLRKLISDFDITSNLFLNVQDLVSGFLELQLQPKTRKVPIIYVFLFQTLPETNSQFTFYSCCLSRLKVSYSFEIWPCYTRGTLVTQVIVKTATIQLLPLR